MAQVRLDVLSTLVLAVTSLNGPIKEQNIKYMSGSVAKKLAIIFISAPEQKALLNALSVRCHSHSSLKPLNRIQRNLTENKISKSSSKFVFFGLIGNRMATLGSDWLIRLLFWNGRTEFNETWQEADLHSLFEVCVFNAPEPKAQVHYCDRLASVVCLR